MKFSPYIKEVIFGEGRPFITAMINIDMGNGNWAEERMILTQHIWIFDKKAVEELILKEVQKVNVQLPG